MQFSNNLGQYDVGQIFKVGSVHEAFVTKLCLAYICI